MSRPSQAQQARLREQGYLHTSAAAAALGVSLRTLYRWIADGRVPAIRVAGSTYLEISGLRAHVGEPAASLLL